MAAGNPAEGETGTMRADIHETAASWLLTAFGVVQIGAILAAVHGGEMATRLPTLQITASMVLVPALAALMALRVLAGGQSVLWVLHVFGMGVAATGFTHYILLNLLLNADALPPVSLTLCAIGLAFTLAALIVVMTIFALPLDRVLAGRRLSRVRTVIDDEAIGLDYTLAALTTTSSFFILGMTAFLAAGTLAVDQAMIEAWHDGTLRPGDLSPTQSLHLPWQLWLQGAEPPDGFHTPRGSSFLLEHVPGLLIVVPLTLASMYLWATAPPGQRNTWLDEHYVGHTWAIIGFPALLPLGLRLLDELHFRAAWLSPAAVEAMSGPTGDHPGR